MTTTTRERFLTFTPENAAAIRERRKNNTRRVIVPQPEVYTIGNSWGLAWKTRCGGGSKWLAKYCPYGQPGDRIRLGTTWGVNRQYDRLRPLQIGERVRVWSYFDGPRPDWVGKLRPARFMPLFLDDRMPAGVITSVKVERVQDISEEDAKAEGTSGVTGCKCGKKGQKIAWCKACGGGCFWSLWDSINLSRPGCSWAENPWTWCIAFKLVSP